MAFERAASAVVLAVVLAVSSLRTDVSLFEAVSEATGVASSEVAPACDLAALVEADSDADVLADSDADVLTDTESLVEVLTD